MPRRWKREDSWHRPRYHPARRSRRAAWPLTALTLLGCAVAVAAAGLAVSILAVDLLSWLAAT